MHSQSFRIIIKTAPGVGSSAAAAAAGVKTYTCSLCKTTKTEKHKYLPGDVDASGSVTAADARLALRRSVGLETYAKNTPQFLACDADCDSNVTAADARMIFRASVGLEDPKTWG